MVEGWSEFWKHLVAACGMFWNMGTLCRTVTATLAPGTSQCSPSEVLQAIGGIKVGKDAGPNNVPNRVLRHLTERVTTFSQKYSMQFSAGSNSHQMETRSRGVHTEAGKRTHADFFVNRSLLDTAGKVFENILLTSVLREVNECGLLRDEQSGIRPRHSTTLQLLERVNTNVHEKRLTGAFFLPSTPDGSQVSLTG
jgi:hypothetical protein